ncbi:hypothetical protein NPIL_698731 [Nephila pilipes]|uniref:Uncharacterized protein n=1 Tax=Nephila pilipes TaxID=299642 RepID=A0A8X6PQV8_NEPPI|nr:hypothetical protein NPIL_698731 [Nephila pilipes]
MALAVIVIHRTGRMVIAGHVMVLGMSRVGMMLGHHAASTDFQVGGIESAGVRDSEVVGAVFTFHDCCQWTGRGRLLVQRVRVDALLAGTGAAGPNGGAGIRCWENRVAEPWRLFCQPHRPVAFVGKKVQSEKVFRKSKNN